MLSGALRRGLSEGVEEEISLRLRLGEVSQSPRGSEVCVAACARGFDTWDPPVMKCGTLMVQPET